MLAAIHSGAYDRVVETLERTSRPRLHETYALMALARGCDTEADAMVHDWLASADRGEKQAVVESSHVSELLFYLPSFLGNGQPDSGSPAGRHYEAEGSQDNDLWRGRMDSRMLHAVLARMSKDTGLKYYLGNARRLTAELRNLQKAGASESLFLEYDSKATRFQGKVTRLWTIELDVASIKSLPNTEPVLDLPEEHDDEVPF